MATAKTPLYVLDGPNGSLDPAFDAHGLPFFMWAMAHWQNWVPVQQLQAAMAHVLGTVHDIVWRTVNGPTAALVADSAAMQLVALQLGRAAVKSADP